MYFIFNNISQVFRTRKYLMIQCNNMYSHAQVGSFLVPQFTVVKCSFHTALILQSRGMDNDTRVYASLPKIRNGKTKLLAKNPFQSNCNI